jgi:hypothetical protein
MTDGDFNAMAESYWRRVHEDGLERLSEQEEEEEEEDE